MHPIISEKASRLMREHKRLMREERINRGDHKFMLGEEATVRSSGPVDITNEKGIIVDVSHKPSYHIEINGRTFPVLESQLRPNECDSNWKFDVGDTVRVRDDCSYVYASISNLTGIIISRLSGKKYSVRINASTSYYDIQEDNMILIKKNNDITFKKGEVVKVLKNFNLNPNVFRKARIENIYKDIDGNPVYKMRMKDNISELFVCSADRLARLEQHEIDELKRPIRIGDVVYQYGYLGNKGVIEHIYKDRYGMMNYVMRLHQSYHGIKRIVCSREQLERRCI